MKKFFGVILSLVCLSFLNVTPALATSVNDFTISDFSADYYLNKNEEGHSTLKTVEKITAIFPEYDQNHGIERLLFKEYDQHSVNLQIDSVTDENSQPVKYQISIEGRKKLIRIGDSDVYVHGTQTYIITYTQHDVTKFFSDINDDEFYWDVNGTGWSQKMTRVSATIHFGDNIKNNLTGDMSCYFGQEGSTNQCKIGFLDENTAVAEVNGLSANEGMTVAIGFTAHTFAEYEKTFIEQYTNVIIIIFDLLAFCLILVLKLSKGRNTPRKKAIVPEYLPPKEVDVLTASIIVNKSNQWMPAMLIDLAVRHKIRILEKEGKTVFGGKKMEYQLELLKTEGLTQNESAIVGALFGSDFKLGDTFLLENRVNNDLALEVGTILRNAEKQTRKDGLLVKVSTGTILIMILLSVALTVVPVVLVNLSILTTVSLLLLGLSILLSIVGFCIILSMSHVLTTKGRELKDYLDGLKMYIKIAETERLKFLQSPTGAEKAVIDTNDAKKMVKLYERALPYAVLFGQEKQWTKVLGNYYEQVDASSPSWYIGNGVFSAALLSSTISSFSQVSNHSSSSGGSSGGGISGGGGGGGGGGGW